MNIEFLSATPQHRTLLRHLFELYCYDFSPMDGEDVSDTGRYTGDDFLAHWPESGWHPFLVKVEGRWAGFAWVTERSQVTPGAPAHFWMGEFFVLQKYRRRGVGEYVATRLFDLFPGTWEVGEIANNVNAQAFWRKVIGRYTGGQYEEWTPGLEQWQGPIQIFNNEIRNGKKTMTTLELATNALLVPDAPALPGLTFRHFRGESDFPNMSAVFDACKVIDRLEWAMSVEDLARFYAHLTNCEPSQDMLFAEMGGRVIGYSRVWWMREDGGNRLYAHFGHLLPEWRRKGIGRAMLRWNETRLREIAAGHPHDAPRFFQAEVSDGEIAKAALLSNEGYTPVRHGFIMVRSLTEPIGVTPLPPGLEVRPVPPEQVRTFWEADQEAFRDHWGFVPGTEADYRRWLNESIFNPGLWQVAWDGDQIAGAVQNFVHVKENEEYNRKRGYTEGIFVRRPWRKRGLARALIMRSLQMFRDTGFTEAALGVDSENLSGALRLYESCGFRAVKRESLCRKPMR